MKKSSKTSIRLDKKVRELFKVEFSELVERYNLNVDDYWFLLERWLKARKSNTQLSLDANIRDIVYLIQQSLEYFTPAETVEILSTENLQILDKNIFNFGFLNYFVTPLYSLEELNLLIITIIEYLNKNKVHLIKYGFPLDYPSQSLWKISI